MEVFLARKRQELRASGVAEPAGVADWAAAAGPAIAWERLFASAGLFGVEIGADGALAGSRVELLGFVSVPLFAEAGYVVLSRSPLPSCPFCVPSASWPDDIVLVHLSTPGVELEHQAREVAVRGVLEVGECAGPEPGLVSHVRLVDAVWRPVTSFAS